MKTIAYLATAMIIVMFLLVFGRDHVHVEEDCWWQKTGDRLVRECVERKTIWWYEKDYGLYT